MPENVQKIVTSKNCKVPVKKNGDAEIWHYFLPPALNPEGVFAKGPIPNPMQNELTFYRGCWSFWSADFCY
jgi:hypothetical protein